MPSNRSTLLTCRSPGARRGRVHRRPGAALKAAVRAQQAEETERQRQAALVEIERRLAGQVELAQEVEQAVRHLGDRWDELLRWRTEFGRVARSVAAAASDRF